MTSFKDKTSNPEAIAPSIGKKFQSSATDLKMWLFLGTAMVALWHGVLNHRLEGEDTVTTAFFWLTALFLLWKKRESLRISPQPLGTTMGLLLLAWVLFRGSATFWFEHDLVQLLPVAAFFALTLIASGWGGLKQYFRPFLALFIFSLVGVLIELFFKANPAGFNITRLTTNVSAFLLHYLGFDVAQEGVYIHLTQGSVEVLYFCTGGPLIALLFQLTLVLMLITPVNWDLLWKLLSGIIGVGFFLGTVRVAILAVVVADKEAFDYWHGTEGNQIFSLIAFSLWIVAAHFIYEHYEKQHSPQATGDSLTEGGRDDGDGSDASLGEVAPVEQNRISTFALNQPRSWLLPIASIALLTVTIATITMPSIGARELPPLEFPHQMSLAGWRLENSESLVEEPDTELSQHRLRSGQEYEYQQGGQNLTVALRLFSPTFGDVENYLRRSYDSSQREAYREGEERRMSGLGSYQVFSDEEAAYLTTCIAPEGKSTVSVSDYVNQTNGTVFHPEGIVPRLTGERSLRERRCLWVHLSTPLNGESPEAKKQVLEGVFQEGYFQWQGLF